MSRTGFRVFWRMVPRFSAYVHETDRVKYFIEHQGIVLTDTERMTDYLVSEAQASPALTWVSVSSAETGAFLGMT